MIAAHQVKGEKAIQSPWTDIWIPIGAGLFLLALAMSAIVVPQLRLLHSLQALIYVAVVIRVRRWSIWGFGAGVTIALAWNGLNLFVTHLTQAGAAAFWSFLHTGHVQRLDTMMVTVGTVAHFILIIACLNALLNQKPHGTEWWKLAGGGVIALAYMALIIAVARLQ